MVDEIAKPTPAKPPGSDAVPSGAARISDNEAREVLQTAAFINPGEINKAVGLMRAGMDDINRAFGPPQLDIAKKEEKRPAEIEKMPFKRIKEGIDQNREKYWEYEPQELKVKSIRYYPEQPGTNKKERFEFEPTQFANSPIGTIKLGLEQQKYNLYGEQNDLPVEKGIYYPDGTFEFRLANAGAVKTIDHQTGKVEGYLLFGDDKPDKLVIKGKILRNDGQEIAATGIENLWGYEAWGKGSRPVKGFNFTSSENGQTKYQMTPTTQGKFRTGPEEARVRNAEEFKKLGSGIEVCFNEFGALHTQIKAESSKKIDRHLAESR